MMGNIVIIQSGFNPKGCRNPMIVHLLRRNYIMGFYNIPHSRLIIQPIFLYREIIQYLWNNLVAIVVIKVGKLFVCKADKTAVVA